MSKTSDLTKEQLLKIKAKAKELDQKARKIQAQVISQPWDVAVLSAEVKKLELFKYMPTTYDKWETWAVDIGYSRSTAFEHWRIYTALMAFIPKGELKKMTFKNAGWLAKLPEDDRKNQDLWKKAQQMKEDDFMQVVQDRQRANGQAVSDGRVNLKIRCYVNQSDFIQGVIKQFAEENNLGDDYGRSLELMCAEIMAQLKGGSSFVEKIRQTILNAAFEASQVNAVIKELREAFADEHKSADETLLAAANAVNKFDEGLAKVIQILADGTKNMGVKPGEKQASIPAKGGANGSVQGHTGANGGGNVAKSVSEQHNRNVAAASPNAGSGKGINSKTGPALVQ
jgi:hypothetical protein